jgi:hypothetical protein
MIEELKALGFGVTSAGRGQSFMLHESSRDPKKVYATWTHKDLRLTALFYEKLSVANQDKAVKLIMRWQQKEGLKRKRALKIN